MKHTVTEKRLIEAIMKIPEGRKGNEITKKSRRQYIWDLKMLRDTNNNAIQDIRPKSHETGYNLLHRYFEWSDSPQGQDYWYKLYNKLEENN